MGAQITRQKYFPPQEAPPPPNKSDNELDRVEVVVGRPVVALVGELYSNETRIRRKYDFGAARAPLPDLGAKLGAAGAG